MVRMGSSCVVARFVLRIPPTPHGRVKRRHQEYLEGGVPAGVVLLLNHPVSLEVTVCAGGDCARVCSCVVFDLCVWVCVCVCVRARACVGTGMCVRAREHCLLCGSPLSANAYALDTPHTHRHHCLRPNTYQRHLIPYTPSATTPSPRLDTKTK